MHIDDIRDEKHVLKIDLLVSEILRERVDRQSREAGHRSTWEYVEDLGLSKTLPGHSSLSVRKVVVSIRSLILSLILSL
jgi:hypothetical protein